MIESQFVPYQATTDLPAQAVLVFAPHADDEVFGCGGSLARHVAAGVPVSVVVLTDGAAGAEGEARLAVMAEREAESRAAAAVLGYPAPEFWQLPDRGLSYSETLIERLRQRITASGADLVYAPSVQEIHPDHRALAMAAVEAVRRLGAGVRLAQYEIGAPLRPNVLVDITPQLASKQAAMGCFVSQLARQRYHEQVEALNRYRAYTLPPEVAAAEAFELLSGAEIAANHLRVFASEYRRRQGLGAACVGSADLPLVSIIIRSMDRRTLDEALDSLALQTYPHLEVLVVNAKGGAHRDLGPQCGPHPLRLINAGGTPLRRSQAANAGLDAAQGELLGFLDDDDLLLPEHCATLVAALSQTPALRAAYTGVRCVDGQGAPLAQQFGQPYTPIRLLAGNFIPIHAVLFRRDARSGSCRFDEALDYYEDWDFWLQLAQLGDFQYLPQVTALYRIAGGAGFGVHGGQDPAVRQALLLLLDKWRQQWSPETINQLLEATLRGYAASEELLQTQESQRQERAQALAQEQALQAVQADLHRQLQALQTRHDVLIAEHHAQTRALHQAQAHAAGLEAQLAGLFASTSWRLTAPLRGLVGLLRRLLGRSG